jgi:hypothetical protein
MSSTGIAIGLNKGFPTDKKAQAKKPSYSKGRSSKRTLMVRELVGEVMGKLSRLNLRIPKPSTMSSGYRAF